MFARKYHGTGVQFPAPPLKPFTQLRGPPFPRTLSHKEREGREKTTASNKTVAVELRDMPRAVHLFKLGQAEKG